MRISPYTKAELSEKESGIILQKGKKGKDTTVRIGRMQGRGWKTKKPKKKKKTCINESNKFEKGNDW